MPDPANTISMSPMVTGNNGDDGRDAAQAASPERLIACEDLVLGYGQGNRFTEIVHSARFEAAYTRRLPEACATA